MPTKIVGGHLDIEFLPIPLHQGSGRGLADREYPICRSKLLNVTVADQPFGNLFRHKSNLLIFTRFWLSQDQLSVRNIFGPESQHLSNSQTTSGLKFEDESISKISGVVYHLVYGFFIQNFLGHLLRHLERSGKKGNATGILHIEIVVLNDQVVEGFKLGISQATSGFGGMLC